MEEFFLPMLAGILIVVIIVIFGSNVWQDGRERGAAEQLCSTYNMQYTSDKTRNIPEVNKDLLIVTCSIDKGELVTFETFGY